MNKLLLFAMSILLLTACKSKPDSTIDLAGNWQFALDRENKEWYEEELTETIKLPGSLQEQGYGEDIGLKTQWTGQVVDSAWYKLPNYEKYRQPGNIKVPFWLNPDKHYVGVAWYQKEIDIPSEWEYKPIFLNMERTHWETTLFVDGKKIEMQNSLATPHRYKLNGLSAGKHILSIRVDNRLLVPIGINAHSVTDHTQTNWNGIIGNIYLECKPQIYIENVTIFPDVKNKTIKIVSEIINNGSQEKKGNLDFIASTINTLQTNKSENKTIAASLKTGTNKIETTLDMGKDALMWDEYTPNVYQLRTKLSYDDITFEKTANFGMREIGKDGRRLTINGTPVFLRGTLECSIFPLTGYPAMDEAYWEKIYKTVKNHGLNHVRFHSWCPPKVAFDVADREGVYLQVECGGWTSVGSGNSFDKWVYEEGDRILKEYGNHPSFFSLLYGNEPGGDCTEFLSNLAEHWRKTDGRHAYSSAGGWPFIKNGDYYNSPSPRIQGWGAGLSSIINSKPPQTAYDFRDIIQEIELPTVSHEIGQWCVYPNLKEIDKYTGVLKAKNFEIFKETLHENHMGDLSEQFLMASGKLQTLCYKADIEAALRTPEFAGFQLLDLHDFPGQGTALVGVLDAFWDSKGYVTPEEYRMFCNRTVPLARMSKMVWESNEIFEASLEVSNFQKNPSTQAEINWSIADNSGKIYKKGSFKSDLPITNCIQIGSIQCSLNEIKEAKDLILTVEIPNLKAKNQWSFWVYPKVDINTDNIYITDKLDAKAQKILDKGGKVLLALRRNSIKQDKGGDIAVGFSSIFWNTAWTAKQAPHVLGILCDPQTPALKYFPTSYHSDYQWWEILSHADAMVMDDFPPDFRPTVHIIDDWFTNRKLGLVYEAKIGNGKLMVTSADLYTDIDKRISAKQFKYSLIEYMKTDAFNPSKSLDITAVQDILKNLYQTSSNR